MKNNGRSVKIQSNNGTKTSLAQWIHKEGRTQSTEERSCT